MTISPCIVCEHLGSETCKSCKDCELLQSVTAVSVWSRYRCILHYIFDNNIPDPEPTEEPNLLDK